ncbi:hypothetical protein LP421_32665 (plasmid) [Rhizobium sp. RCAM05350]|nr:hypothetical protein LP421_32665 [Rhizobium sp. RCAM05350]
MGLMNISGAAAASYFVGAFDKAVSRIQSMSNQASAYRLLAASCAMLGDTRRANHYRRKDRETNPQFDLQKWLAVVPIKEPWQKEMYRGRPDESRILRLQRRRN